MAALQGLRVALLEAHSTEKAVAHVRQHGGIPYSVPAVREAVHLDRVAPFVDALTSRRVSVVVFLTGVGATMLLDEATRLGRLDETLSGLRLVTIACRGPKPIAVLQRYNVPVQITAADPFTTAELLAALTTISLKGMRVAVVHYGERSRALTGALAAMGAELEELSLYEWTLPPDTAPLEALVRALIAGTVEAIAFTNRIQCRHLFRVAEAVGLSSALTDALNGDIIVAAVGPVCADALHSLGVMPDVIPARPTMDAMIGALAEYVELTEGL